jgi:hypothetical protein
MASTRRAAPAICRPAARIFRRPASSSGTSPLAVAFPLITSVRPGGDPPSAVGAARRAWLPARRGPRTTVFSVFPSHLGGGDDQRPFGGIPTCHSPRLQCVRDQGGGLQQSVGRFRHRGLCREMSMPPPESRRPVHIARNLDKHPHEEYGWSSRPGQGAGLVEQMRCCQARRRQDGASGLFHQSLDADGQEW